MGIALPKAGQRLRSIFCRGILLSCIAGSSAAGAVAAGTNSPASPVVSFAATFIAFNDQATGTSSKPKSITLTNTGGAPLVLNAVTSSGLQADDFSATSGCEAALAPGSSCKLSVIFDPVSAGSKSAKLSIDDNAPGSPHTVTLTGTGVGRPALRLSGTSVTFGNQVIGASSVPKTVTLTNSGNAPLHLLSFRLLSDGEAQDFAVTNQCGTSLDPNTSCVISVAFTPVTAGIKSANFEIFDDAPGAPQSFALLGTGIAGSGLVVSAPALHFPSQIANTSSSMRSVTLTNFTSAPVRINSIAVAGGEIDDFSASNSCAASLGPGANCWIGIIFKPVSAGKKSALLRIDSSYKDQLPAVALSGLGTNPTTSFQIFNAPANPIEVHSTDTQMPTFAAQLGVANPPPQPLTVSIAEELPGGASSVISKYSYQSQSSSFPVLTITFKPGANLSIGVHSETLLVSLCTDAACAQKIAGSPQRVAVNYEVLATSGKDYTQWFLALNAEWAAWDRKDNEFCVLRTTNAGEELAMVEPMKGTILNSITLQSNHTGLAVSDDGQFVYVAFGTTDIQRYKLPGLTPDITIALPPNLSFSSIEAAPGAAHTIFVSATTADPDVLTSMLMVFDDEKMRPGTVTLPYTSNVTWGSPPSTLFGRSDAGLYVFAVAPSGLSISALDTNLGNFYGGMQFQAGLLYSSQEYIFDPYQNRVVGHFPIIEGGEYTLADASLQRAFVWGMFDGSLHVEDLTKLTQIGVASFPGVVNVGLPMFRWGQSGLAFVTYDGSLFVIQGSLINPDASP